LELQHKCNFIFDYLTKNSQIEKPLSTKILF